LQEGTPPLVSAPEEQEIWNRDYVERGMNRLIENADARHHNRRFVFRQLLFAGLMALFRQNDLEEQAWRDMKPRTI
jgi:hypothetical protein